MEFQFRVDVALQNAEENRKIATQKSSSVVEECETGRETRHAQSRPRCNRLRKVFMAVLCGVIYPRQNTSVVYSVFLGNKPDRGVCSKQIGSKFDYCHSP